MKKSMTFKLFAFALLSLVMTACSKYEEGSKFTVLTKKQRLVNTWTMSKTTSIIDATGAESDITSLLPAITVDIKKDGTVTVTSVYTIGGISTTTTDEGTWVFSDDKLTVITTDSNGDSSTATIIKLKNKELKMSTNANGVTTVSEYTGA